MSIKNKIVFIIDDDPEIILLLTKIFEAQGMAVLSATNLIDARKIIETSQPHLVFLDIKLEKENGLTFLSYLRSSPQGKDLPIIIFSAIDNTQIVKRSMALGASDYVCKPINANQIMQKVKKHLMKAINRHHIFIDYKSTVQKLVIHGKITEYNQHALEVETCVKFADAAKLELNSKFCEKIKFKDARFINKGKVHNLGKGKYLHTLYYVALPAESVECILNLEEQ